MYTSATQVSNFLQRDLTDYETAELPVLVAAIKTWLDKRLSSTFDKVEPTTRTYDGGVRNVDIDPCTEISQIEAINDDGTGSYVYTDPYEIMVEPQNETVKREIRKRLAAFPRGVARLSVTAKFSEYDENAGGVPADIQVVATRLAAGIINQGKYQGKGGATLQESLEGHEIRYQVGTSQILGLVEDDPTVKSILAEREDLFIDNYDRRNELGNDDDEGGLLA